MLFTWNDRLLDRDMYIPWQFLKALLYDYNLNRKCITLCCWLAIVVAMLLQARCHCTSGVGVCGRMWSGQY